MTRHIEFWVNICCMGNYGSGQRAAGGMQHWVQAILAGCGRTLDFQGWAPNLPQIHKRLNPPEIIALSESFAFMAPHLWICFSRVLSQYSGTLLLRTRRKVLKTRCCAKTKNLLFGTTQVPGRSCVLQSPKKKKKKMKVYKELSLTSFVVSLQVVWEVRPLPDVAAADVSAVPRQAALTLAPALRYCALRLQRQRRYVLRHGKHNAQNTSGHSVGSCLQSIGKSGSNRKMCLMCFDYKIFFSF